MSKENGKGWKEELPTALWAHRTTKSQATGASPFCLVYGIEVVIPIDLVMPVVKLVENARMPEKILWKLWRKCMIMLPLITAFTRLT